MLLGDLPQGNIRSHLRIVANLNPHILDDRHFPVENVPGQAIIRNPPGRHPPWGSKAFEHSDGIPHLG